MKYLRICFLLLFALTPSIHANDYGLGTNLVTMRRYTLPWPISVILINTVVPSGEQRRTAVSSLVRYKSRFLVHYLKKYAQDPDPAVRAAAVWPLYKNGEKDLALSIIEREATANSLNMINVFWAPSRIGGDYKAELAKGDVAFQNLISSIATNSKIDPWIRTHAAIQLVGIGEVELAKKIASEILRDTPGEKNFDKDYNKRTEEQQRYFHQRKRAEYCLHLIEQYTELKKFSTTNSRKDGAAPSVNK